MSTKNVILILVIIVLGGGAVFLGHRHWQEAQQQAEEQYRRELDTFGRREMGAPVLSPPHFARHGENALPDVAALLDSPSANHLAKQQALEVILLIQGNDAVPLLIEQTERQPSPVRETALALLGRSGTAPAAEFLAQAASRRDIAVPALAALAEMPRQAASHTEKILPLLDHEDPAVAAQAALTLGSIGGEQARQALTQRLDHPRLAQPAARGLARMRDERGIAFLIDILRGQRPGDRAAAEAGLAEAGSPAAAPVENLLQSDDQQAIASALRVLRTVGDAENFRRWLPFVRSNDANVRLAALDLFETKPIPEAGREVFLFLAANRARLNENEVALAERIARLTSREDFDFYAAQMRSDDEAAQVNAIRVIAYSQDRRAIDLLIAGLSDQSPTIRRESALSLGRLHGIGGLGQARERVFNQISRLAEDDPDNQVRSTARSLLVVLR